jgi:hypothetical protein
LGYKIPNRDFTWEKNINDLFPQAKAFYRPTISERQKVYNLFALADRSPYQGLTRQQRAYVLDAYKTILQNDMLDKRALEAAVKKITDTFPDKNFEETLKIYRKRFG